jgi:hypothetical protein
MFGIKRVVAIALATALLLGGVVTASSGEPAAADGGCDPTDLSGLWYVVGTLRAPNPAAGIPLSGSVTVSVDVAGEVRWYTHWSTGVGVNPETGVTVTYYPDANPPTGTLTHVGTATCTSMHVVPVDRDGVPDPDLTQELTGTATHLEGTANNAGVPYVDFQMTKVGPPDGDTDSDGTRNDVDQCPFVAGLFANSGCPLAVQVTTNVVGAGPNGDQVPLVWYANAQLTPAPRTTPSYRWYLDGALQPHTASNVAFSITDPGAHTLRLEVYSASGALLGSDTASISPTGDLVPRITFTFSTKQPSKYVLSGLTSSGAVTKYLWSVDDQSYSPKAAGTLPVTLTPGPHSVSLVVADRTGKRSAPATRQIVAYRLVVDAVGATDSVAKASVSRPDATCTGARLEIEPTSNWWSNVTVTQDGVKRPFRPDAGSLARADGADGPLPPASMVDRGNGSRVPYRLGLEGGCFDDLNQHVTVTTDLTGPEAVKFNALEILVGFVDSPISLRDFFTVLQTTTNRWTAVLKLIDRMPDLQAAAACMRTAPSDLGAAYTCTSLAFNRLWSSPAQMRTLRDFYSRLAGLNPLHAVAYQVIVNRLTDVVNAFGTYVTALRRCGGGAPVGEGMQTVLFVANFVDPIPLCTAGTVAARIRNLQAVGSARVDLAFAIATSLPLGSVGTGASILSMLADYSARAATGALSDTLVFHTSASTDPP